MLERKYKMPCINPRWQATWNQDIEIIRYELQFNQEFFVGQGIGGPDGGWCTFIRKRSGSLKRVVSKFLPMRETKEEAERDLYVWLRDS
jgi:hypothetical protein